VAVGPQNGDSLDKPSHIRPLELEPGRRKGSYPATAFPPGDQEACGLGILSDVDIRVAISSGALAIEPFSEASLTPNGYDLRMAEVLLPGTGDRWTEGTAQVPAMTRFMVSTMEVVKLGPGLTAQLWLRTTWARRGVLASFGRIDAGFAGTLTFGALNASSEELSLPMGDTFAQMVLEELTGRPLALYAERSGHYQEQRGVTMAVPEREAPNNPVEGDR
jgi:dCTP deaminase